MSYSYSISDLTRTLRVTHRAVRLYEERGLVRASRDRNNVRRYSREDRERLALLVDLRKVGLGLSEIKQILDADTPARADLIRDAIDRQLERSQSALAAMQEAAERLRSAADSAHPRER